MDATTALLIVDVQNGFVNDHTNHIPPLIEQLQSQDIYRAICATQFHNGSHSPFVNWLGWEGLMDKESSKLAFKPLSQTLIVSKNGYYSATAEVLSFFDKHKIKKVHICGIDTNMCVFVTAAGLFEQGVYEPFVLSKYCASHSGKEYHDAGLMLLGKAIGKHHIL